MQNLDCVTLNALSDQSDLCIIFSLLNLRIWYKIHNSDLHVLIMPPSELSAQWSNRANCWMDLYVFAYSLLFMFPVIWPLFVAINLRPLIHCGPDKHSYQMVRLWVMQVSLFCYGSMVTTLRFLLVSVGKLLLIDIINVTLLFLISLLMSYLLQVASKKKSIADEAGAILHAKLRQLSPPSWGIIQSTDVFRSNLYSKCPGVGRTNWWDALKWCSFWSVLCLLILWGESIALYSRDAFRLFQQKRGNLAGLGHVLGGRLPVFAQ